MKSPKTFVETIVIINVLLIVILVNITNPSRLELGACVVGVYEFVLSGVKMGELLIIKGAIKKIEATYIRVIRRNNFE